MSRTPRLAGHAPRVLLLGAGGRLGRLVARAWALEIDPGVAAVAQARRADALPPSGGGVVGHAVFAPLEGTPSDLGPIDVVVDLTGVTRGPTACLARNTDLALAALAAARALGARHVLLPSSAAVYGSAGTGEPAPASDYGRAKLAMERAAAASGAPHTCLRIGNVVGADALVAGNPSGEAVIDRFPGGRGPRRAYVGPVGLARVLAALARRAARGDPMPRSLDVAAPGLVAMEDLADAAGLRRRWRPAPDGAIAEVALDTGPLGALAPGAAGPGGAEAMVAEWRRLAEPART